MTVKRTTIATLLVTLAVGFAVVPASGAHASPASSAVTVPEGFTPVDDASQIPAPRRLRNHNSGKCLVVRTGSGGAPAVQTTCASWRDQYWTLQYVRSTPDLLPLYRLQNDNSGQCLTVRGGVQNSQAIQFPCYDFNDQLWIGPWDGPYMMFQNYNSRMCLLARTGAAEAPAVQDVCNSNFRDQFWYWD